MWLWTGAIPLWWFSGIPFSGVLFFFGSPTLPLVAAMFVVLLGTGLVARRALNCELITQGRALGWKEISHPSRLHARQAL